MIWIVMGVSGSGKTTVGGLLAARLGCPFYDGDDYHPPANIEKMSRGVALDDRDRAGWLDTLARIIARHVAENRPAVLACSALKQAYRSRLAPDPSRVRFVYLKGDYDLILARMQRRPGHYMKPEMLAGQFAALEEPVGALNLPVELTPQEIVEKIIAGSL